MKKPPILKSNVRVEDTNGVKREGPTGLIMEGSGKDDEFEEKAVEPKLEVKPEVVEKKEEVKEEDKGKIRMGRLGAKK